jgi:hypothetical protein
MQIDLFQEDSMTFKITNTGDDAVKVFHDIMEKCKKESSRIGIKNMFSTDEKIFIKEFMEKLSGDEIKY